MRLKGSRESKNFEDHTLGNWVRTAQGGSLLDSLLKSTDVTQGAPEGYENWLNSTLHDFTPQDLYIMKTQGLNIEQMSRLKNHIGAIKSGMFDGDVSAYPYNDKFGDEVVKRERRKSVRR